MLLTAAQPLAAHGASEARYLGNEGVLVAHQDTKVLFDAFYAESFGGAYRLVPARMEEAMMAGRPPFDGIDAIFISHIHRDHFHSRKTIAYLRSHPGVRLYAGADVVSALRADLPADDPLLERIVRVNVAPGAAPARFEIDQIAIEAFSIPHVGGAPVPNYAYRVTLAGTATAMHLGDAAPEDRHYSPYQRHFDEKKTHLLFAPFWMLVDEAGKLVIEQRLKATKVIGIHLRADVRERAEAMRRTDEADVFIEPGEVREIDLERR